MIKEYDTITFDRPENFLRNVRWGSFILSRQLERDIGISNFFQTTDLRNKKDKYKLTLDGLLFTKTGVDHFNGSIVIYTLIRSLKETYFVSFRLYFESKTGRTPQLVGADCLDVREIIHKTEDQILKEQRENFVKIESVFDDEVEAITKNHENSSKDLIKACEAKIKHLLFKHDLEKKYTEAQHELEMEKFKAEQLIIFNKKLGDEIKAIIYD